MAWSTCSRFDTTKCVRLKELSIHSIKFEIRSREIDLEKPTSAIGIRRQLLQTLLHGFLKVLSSGTFTQKKKPIPREALMTPPRKSIKF
jgi:hypothetical protein